MICPKCKIEIKENVQYCIRCGYIFKNEMINDFKKPNDRELKDNELVDLYLGNTSNMKLKTLFLNYTYFYYKGDFYNGFLYMFFTFLLLKTAIGSQTSHIVQERVSLVNGTFYGLFVLGRIALYLLACLYYLRNGELLIRETTITKIKRIKSKYEDKNFEELKEIVQKEGKKDKTIGIIASIINIIIIIILFGIFVF